MEDNNPREALLQDEREDEQLRASLPEDLMRLNRVRRNNSSVWLHSGLAGLLVILVSVWAEKQRGGFTLDQTDMRLFNLHPFLMVLGPICCSSISIILFKAFSGCVSHSKLKKAHLLLQLISFGCLTVGITVVYIFHAENKFPHFHSLHAWLGLLAAILFFLQFSVGFVSFYFPVASSETRYLLLQPHKKTGIIMVLIVFPAVTLTGLLEKMTFTGACKELQTECLTINLMGIVLLAFSAISMWIVIEKI